MSGRLIRTNVLSLMASPDTRPRTIYLNILARQMDIPSAVLFRDSSPSPVPLSSTSS